jgi:uncharacterized protein (TIGR03086 family)
MEPVDVLTRATAGYQRRLAAIGVEQWDQSSVCAGWTVKYVADHVLGGNRFAVPMISGATADAAFEHALAGGFDGDPVALFEESAESQLEAFGGPGALDAVVHHPDGDIAGRTFLFYRVGDLLLHGWDLARSTGGDDDLDEELVPEVWHAYQPLFTGGAEPAVFGTGASGEVSDDAPLSLRLLDLTGRRL